MLLSSLPASSAWVILQGRCGGTLHDITQMLETPLSRAVHNGHLQTARHLLDKGADVNCLDIVRSNLLAQTGGHSGERASL